MNFKHLAYCLICRSINWKYGRRKGLHLVPIQQCQIYRTLILPSTVICCFSGTSEDGHSAAILVIQRAFVHIMLSS
ncbi:hypothetical protein K1719_010912 [Acacia pycnantha]|nr:hypothetical protein K1719_010912 [Acacia pycnantha]